MNNLVYSFLLFILFSFQSDAKSIKQFSTLCENDSLAPTVTLLPGKVVALYPPYYPTVFPQDLITSVQDDCTDSIDLVFKLWYGNNSNPDTITLSNIENLSDSLVFKEDQLGTQTVYIIVFDDKGNYVFSSTYLLIQCNDCGHPPFPPQIEGKILLTNGVPVDSVKIKIAKAPELEIYTNEDGNYAFIDDFDNSLELIPTKGTNPLEDVSSFDLLLIQKHILGLQTFDSPYKFVAADVDFSGSVTTFDIISIKKVLLGKENTYPIGDSWRFVWSDYEFNTYNPANEDYPTSWKKPEANINYNGIDFIAVKLGDVNDNY